MLRKCVLAWLLPAALVLPSIAASADENRSEYVIRQAVESFVAARAEAMPAPEVSAPEVQPAKAEAQPAPAAPVVAAVKSGNDTKTEPAPASAESKKPAPAPEPTLKAAVDLGAQQITVSEGGSVLYTWPISSGTSEHPTPRGTFRPQWTAKMWYSRKYDNAPMPNAVFISGGVAIHATPYVRSLGNPASHGCIRLAPANAAIFYKLVQKHGLANVRVSVYGTPNWREPQVASRSSIKRYYATTSYEKPSLGDWLFGSSKPQRPAYRANSAYDYGFVPKSKKYQANNARIYYRGSDSLRYVYRSPRRAYYYDGW